MNTLLVGYGNEYVEMLCREMIGIFPEIYTEHVDRHSLCDAECGNGIYSYHRALNIDWLEDVMRLICVISEPLMIFLYFFCNSVHSLKMVASR